MRGEVSRFNAGGFHNNAGRPLWVNALALESNECIEETLAGRHQPDIISLTCTSLVDRVNAQARARNEQPLLGDTFSLARSPLVIAMWKPLAEAMGYGKRPLGWTDLRELATDPRGWGKYGQPGYGSFKLGHNCPYTSPEGLLAVLGETAVGAGAVKTLTTSAIQAPATAAFVGDIEKAIATYGDNPTLLGSTLAAGGQKAMSAALLYENQVYTINKHFGKPELLAIYPSEGTFYCDHPAGVVNRAWVTPERRAAAGQFLQFLRSPDEQAHTSDAGLRPANSGTNQGAPFDADHGLDPAPSLHAFEPPGPVEAAAAISLWHAQRKPADVVVVADDGGVLIEKSIMIGMQSGLKGIVARCRSADALSMLLTDREHRYLFKGAPLGPQRRSAGSAIDGLLADGDDSIFDGIAFAYDTLAARQTPGVLQAIVVIDANEDLQSGLNMEGLLQKLRAEHLKHPIAVYTIQYTDHAPIGPLQSISAATGGRMFSATPEDLGRICNTICQYL